MLRVLLVLLALLAPAPFVAHVALPGPQAAPSGGDGAPDAPGSGAVVSFDTPELGPGGTWILWPVTRDAPGNILVADRSDIRMDGAQSAHAMLAFFDGARWGPAMGMGDAWSSRVADAHVAGLRVEPDTPGGSAESKGHGNVTGFASPSRPAWIGLVTTDWAAGSTTTWTVDGLGSTVHVGAPRVGHDVRLIDLVEAARRDGTNAQVFGLNVGQPGGADEIAPAAPTVLALTTAGAGATEDAHLTLLAEGQTKLDTPLSQHWATGVYAGPGPFEARLDALRQSSGLPVNAPGNVPDMPVHAATLLANLDFALSGPGYWASQPTD